MSENTIAQATSAIDEALDTVSKQREMISEQKATIDGLRNRSTQWSREVARLNELMNIYADENSLCDQYEQTLDEWNGEFSLIKLEGRERTYYVRTRVEMVFDVNVEVQAKNPDEAMEKVGDMYVSDIIDETGLSIGDYDDYTVDPQSASLDES